jgi:hypothetical protein
MRVIHLVAALFWLSGCVLMSACSGGEASVQTSGAGGSAVTCPSDQTLCEGLCVRIELHPAHCGACGKACPDEQVCSLAECGTECVGGTIRCGDRCVDPIFDPLHCGSCNNACAEGQVCSEGQCGLTCLGGTTLCDGHCVDAAKDINHCGACGTVCENDEVCSAGQCGLECVGGATKCAGGCIDTQFDPAHCGACNTACGAGEVCSAGQCGLLCLGGTSKCGTQCVDTQLDIAHCGGCNVACTTGEVCAAGVCQLECVGGTTKCGNTCVDTQVDPLHCGHCNNPCPGGQVCSAGNCGLECVGGTTKCGTLCVDTVLDPAHCGACNTACAQDEVCSNGSCQLDCVGGTTKCGTLCVNTLYDPANCGACNMACTPGANMVAACANGSCKEFCATGFGDCNMQVGDGCESNLSNSTANCGACGNVCGAVNASVKCAAAVCALDSCNAAYADCDNSYNTGCEIHTDTDDNNCGMCGTVCGVGKECSGGTCVDAAPPATFEASFTTGQNSPTQCGTWNTWRAGLTNNYTKLTMYGTNNTGGISCSDATVVNNMAAALKNGTKYTAACDGNTWSLCDRYSGELWLNPPTECSGNNCPSGYIVRPCIGNPNWGGVNTNTCSAPSQTMGVRFE